MKRLLVVLIALSLFACSEKSPTSPGKKANPSSYKYEIAFERHSDTDYSINDKIWIVNIETGQFRNVTPNQDIYEANPKDWNKLTGEIYWFDYPTKRIMAAKDDGSSFRQISSELSCPDDTHPRQSCLSISYDCQYVLYSNEFGIAIVKTDGSSYKLLDGRPVRGARFSPKSNNIAAVVDTVADNTIKTKLYIMDLSGKTLNTFFNSNKSWPELTIWASGFPVWSPDGKKIIQAFIINLSTSQILPLPAVANEYSWTPDSDKIVFSDYENDDICTINIDGTDRKILYDYGSRPQYSPDGAYLAFTTTGGLAVMDSKNNVKILDRIYGPPYLWRPI